MAERPVFMPSSTESNLVRTELVEFDWSPGFAVSQKQKSIRSLHDGARTTLGLQKVLEISSKSPNHLGLQLSAFKLTLPVPGSGPIAVECVFQSSKVFVDGGPYRDLLTAEPLAAKRDPRLKTSGHLVRFEYQEEIWALEPPTAFYDWLYLAALAERPDLQKGVLEFEGFTDIEFNPKKSINCQARSCALFVALHRAGRIGDALSDRDTFLKIVATNGKPEPDGGHSEQNTLW